MTVSNPLDLNIPWQSDTGVSLDDAGSIATCLVEGSEGETDAIVMMVDVPRTGNGIDLPWLPSLEALVEARRRTGLPVVATGIFPDGLAAEHRAWLQDRDVAALAGMTETLEALGGAARASARISELAPKDARPLPLFSSRPPLAPRMLDENESKSRLAASGLVFPPRWCGAPGDAGAAADRLGYPVAVKVLSADVAHKARFGGVRLGLRSASDVAAAAEEVVAAVGTAQAGAAIAGVLVERMVEDVRHELILGIKRHAELGLALLVGLGGVAVEAQRSYALTLLPASGREFSAALDRLAVAGLGACARDAVLRAMVAVAEFAVSHRDVIVELDINPLIVTGDHRAIAVDALLVIGEAGPE
ncbi:MAG: acetate--CoA ligase family protein [Hyphomicrobiaceae bacterium]